MKDLSEFDEGFVKSYNEKSKEIAIQYPENLHNVLNNLPFLPERMKTTETAEKLVTNLHDKNKYVVHIGI